MRKNRLLTATALSLTLAAFSLTGHALAATTISTATTSPVSTSTTGDLTVTSAGSITLTSGTAVTVDSDNDVTLVGKIDMSKSANNSTGILINGGHTGDIVIGGLDANNAAVGGIITVTDDFTPTDTKNSDTIVDGPFAQGTGRYGIHSLGATPLIGNVDVKSPSTITIDGNQSYGIRFENGIQGAITMDGAIAMTGDDNVGVSLENGVTGRVYLSGSINVIGKDSSAVVLKGNYGDTVLIDGAYSGRGYATIDALTAEALAKVQATPEDMYQSGVLVDIQGNVAKGI
ncbi:MAG: autotransporter outer membrane beta-barrel domain-containing protein, partial [Asticcacaulis sp.]|nr:autotransporter outer membrane beta-barrel domain-containing protein [Asticcacaulis sp.]